MLNPNWKKYLATDADAIRRIKKFYSSKNVFNGSIDDLHPEDKAIINHLLARYYVSEKGSPPSLTQNLYAKLSMLGKLFNEFTIATLRDSELWEEENRSQWNEQDRHDYEEEMRKRKEEVARLSARDKVALAFYPGLTNIGRYWIDKSGKANEVSHDVHHSEWIIDHREVLDDREKNIVKRLEHSPKEFMDILFMDGWIRVSDNVAQMYSEFNMPNLAEFLKSKHIEDGEIMVIYIKDGQEKVMGIKDIISKYDPNPEEGFQLVASDIGGNGSKKPDEDFDAKQLAKGTKHEADEHNLSEEDAKKVSKDHLIEIPDYYTKIEEMEKKVKASGSLGLVRISSRDNAVEDMINYTKKYIKPKSKDNKAAEEMVEYAKKYKG